VASAVNLNKKSTGNQCCGYMTFWCGSGSVTDPDPSIFIIDLQNANKKLIKNKSFSAPYFLKELSNHFS
jgi:hypothetical protein